MSNGASPGGALGSEGSLLSGGYQGGQGVGNGAMAGAAAADTDLAEDAVAADDSQWVNNGASDDGGVGASSPQLGDSYGGDDGVDADGDDAGEDAQQDEADQVQAQRDDDAQAQQAHQDDVAQQKADAPKTLDKYTPDQIANMKPEQVAALAEKTDFRSLDKDQIKAINDDPKLSEAATNAYAKQALDKALSPKPLNLSQAAKDAAASAAGTAPPPAVTVRVTNPDKL